MTSGRPRQGGGGTLLAVVVAPMSLPVIKCATRYLHLWHKNLVQGKGLRVRALSLHVHSNQNETRL